MAPSSGDGADSTSSGTSAWAGLVFTTQREELAWVPKRLPLLTNADIH